MGHAHDGYKKSVNVRREIASMLEKRVTGIAQRALEPVDAFDAALCVLAGLDFLEGKAWPPTDQADVLKEGWIWFKRTDD